MKLKDACFLGKKAMTKPDSILKIRDITLLTKVHLVKAMVFPVVTYGSESWNIKKAAAAAKLLQSFPTLCDPTDDSPPGSPVPGILQARTLEWVAISFSNTWKWKVKVKWLSHVRLLASAKELILLNWGAGEDSWGPLGLQGSETSQS